MSSKDYKVRAVLAKFSTETSTELWVSISISVRPVEAQYKLTLSRNGTYIYRLKLIVYNIWQIYFIHIAALWFLFSLLI